MTMTSAKHSLVCAGIAPPSIPSSIKGIADLYFQPFNGLFGLLARTRYGKMYGSVGADFVQARLQDRTLTSWELMPSVTRKVKNALVRLFSEGGGYTEEEHYENKKEQAIARWKSVKAGWKYLFGGKIDD